MHPSWYGLTHDDARSLPFAHAVEIYNHGSALEFDRGNDWPFLDSLLNDGWRLSGYATDDAHHLTHDWLGGWVMVKAIDNDPDTLLEAIKQGHYYSSQGPAIDHIEVRGENVYIECSAASFVSLQGRGSRAVYEKGDEMTSAVLPLRRILNVAESRDRWFRITIRDANGKRAWSNPVWLDI